MRLASCVLGAAIVLSAGTAGPALGAQHTAAAAPQQGAPTPTAFVSGMDAGMAKMMADMHAPGYSGNVDIDFLVMMIPHHEGAVEMARLVLVHGADPITRRLAEEIIAGQQVEIEGMRRRLEQLRGGGSLTAPDGFPALGGTRQEGPGR